jgi:predicted secreted protein
MRRMLLLLACLAPLAAAAQAPAPPDRTMLQLSETAEITVKQDELYAQLAVEVRAASAAAAQAAVNRAMTVALERARATPGVTVATGGYNVWRAYGSSIASNQAWQASQSMTLTAADPAPLLELVGTLQAQGLAVRQLAFRVSRELWRTTREQATEQAVRGLQARAARMAGLLGLEFERFARVDLDGGRERPMPSPAPMMARADSVAAAPVAEAGEDRVSATISAQAVLRPR